MYLIYTTGNRNPYEVTTLRGEAIKKQLEENPGSDNFIDLGGRMFRISTVKEIEYVPEPRSSSTPELIPLLADEEREKRQTILVRMRKELEGKGVFGKKKRNPDITWHTYCQSCGNENPPNMARVCSSACYMKVPNPELT